MTTSTPAVSSPARRNTTNLPVREPPCSLEAEQSVLGCNLLAPRECLPLCIAKLRGSSEPFYDARHQALYELLVSIHDEKTDAIDLLLIKQRLKD